MEVLFFQIGIFVLIQLSCLFGKSARNGLILILTVFTIFAVFANWLLILQLFTIFISYQFSTSWFKNETTKQPDIKTNIVRFGYRENGMNSLLEVDLNDKNLDPKLRKQAELQQNLDNYVADKYENDPEDRQLVNAVIASMFMRAHGTHPSQAKEINLETKFYYIKYAEIYGPISAQSLIKLVKSKRIDRNCFVRQESEKSFERRAHEIVELLKK